MLKQVFAGSIFYILHTFLYFPIFWTMSVCKPKPNCPLVSPDWFSTTYTLGISENMATLSNFCLCHMYLQTFLCEHMLWFYCPGICAVNDFASSNQTFCNVLFLSSRSQVSNTRWLMSTFLHSFENLLNHTREEFIWEIILSGAWKISEKLHPCRWSATFNKVFKYVFQYTFLDRWKVFCPQRVQTLFVFWFWV